MITKALQVLRKSLMRVKRPKSIFGISVLSVSIVLFLLLLDFRRWRWQANFADTASTHEIINSLSRGNWFGSHLLGSVGVAFRYVVQNPNAQSLYQIPDFPLNSQPNQFYNHAFLILIPLALLNLIINYRILIDSIQVLLTLAPFIMLIFVLRRSYTGANRTKLILLSLLVTIVFACFPGINYIALGQFYPDRLIILFLPLTMLAIERLEFGNDGRSVGIFVALAIMSISVTERGSLYVVLVTFGMLFFRLARNPRNFTETLHRNFSVLLVGVSALAWSVIYIRFITRNRDTISTGDSISHFSWAHSQLFTWPSLKLILLSLPLLLIAAKYKDLAIIGFAGLLPNLLGNYFFNLRTAWFAHYMSYLSATLIGVLLIAVRRDLQNQVSPSLSQWMKSRHSFRLIIASALAILFAFLIDPVTEAKLIEPTKQIRLGAFTEAKYWWLNPSYRQQTRRVISADFDLANEIPSSSSVVVTEYTAQFVGGRVRNTDYYPINIEISDYVLIFSTSPIGQPFYPSPVTSWASPAGAQRITAEVGYLLNSDCFEIVGRNVEANLFLFHRIKVISDNSTCHARNG